MRKKKNCSIGEKEMLTMEEAVAYTCLGERTLSNLVRENAIPYYRPMLRSLYFKKSDLLHFLQNGRVASADEINLETSKMNQKITQNDNATIRLSCQL